MWWVKEKSLLMLLVCSTSGGNVTFELKWSPSSTLQKRVKSHINLVWMWLACLFIGPCMYVYEVCFYRNEEVGKISCWDQEWKKTHVVKLRWLKVWMSSLIMNFFACPFLAMNLAFRHDEEEEAVISKVRSREVMVTNRGVAGLENAPPPTTTTTRGRGKQVPFSFPCIFRQSMEYLCTYLSQVVRSRSPRLF